MLEICRLNVLVLHEMLLVPILMYGSETMLWKEKERSRIRGVQMDNLIGLIGIRRMDRFLNAWIRVCRVTKGVNERIDEGVLPWFGHVERDRIAKRVLVVIQWVGQGIDGLIL